MNIEKIDGKLYQEVDIKQLQSKLDQLKQQKESINYVALEDEYKSNVEHMKQYEETLDAEISKLELLLKDKK